MKRLIIEVTLPGAYEMGHRAPTFMETVVQMSRVYPTLTAPDGSFIRRGFHMWTFDEGEKHVRIEFREEDFLSIDEMNAVSMDMERAIGHIQQLLQHLDSDLYYRINYE